MGLFQRKPQVTDPIQLYYTVGMSNTLLIAGLGNIGTEYDGTRHNIGFVCLDDFVRRNDDLGDWTEKKSLKCWLASGQLGQTRVICIKPTTFMNLSGEAVQAVMNYYKITPDKLIVVHDELDIPFGQIRARHGGSSAGHNGIKSVTQHVGEEYGRVRIGIGPKKPKEIDSADFVLQKFSAKELKDMPALSREVSAMLSEYAYGTKLAAETRSFLI
ncbi:MAG TPA: aminoacyl-tRNA hydrolase [Candidatus Saccharimonadales bacterium]|nr:aminoacyl-tRNA hydrolase [Candidatus Saccharimonadales bacterium]